MNNFLREKFFSSSYIRCGSTKLEPRLVFLHEVIHFKTPSRAPVSSKYSQETQGIILS